MRAIVYVIHFDRPLEHARHYCGMTVKPARRFRRHAAGQGSRLMAAVKAAGIGWTLGLVVVCELGKARKIERALKESHELGRHCTLCSDLARGGAGKIRAMGGIVLQPEALGVPLRAENWLGTVGIPITMNRPGNQPGNQEG